MSNTVLEMIFHKQQEMLNLSIKAQKLHICYLGPKIWDLLPKKTLNTWKILTFLNQMLSFGSRRTVHVVCAIFI